MAAALLHHTARCGEPHTRPLCRWTISIGPTALPTIAVLGGTLDDLGK